MKKFFYLLPVMLCLNLLVVSCGSDNGDDDPCGLVGTWCSWVNNACETGADITISKDKYTKDGISLDYTVSSDCKKITFKALGLVVEESTFSISNGILTVTDSDGEVFTYKKNNINLQLIKKA